LSGRSEPREASRKRRGQPNLRSARPERHTIAIYHCVAPTQGEDVLERYVVQQGDGGSQHGPPFAGVACRHKAAQQLTGPPQNGLLALARLRPADRADIERLPRNVHDP